MFVINVNNTNDNNNNAKYDDESLVKALETLLQEKDINQKKLAKMINMPSPTISNYMQRRTKADWYFIKKVAETFSVSADWLLGLSSVMSPEVNIQAIHKATGLSESAIRILMTRNENAIYSKGLSNLIEEDTYLPALTDFMQTELLYELYKKYDIIPKKPESAEEAIRQRTQRFNDWVSSIPKKMKKEEAISNQKVLSALLREYVDESACFKYWIDFGFRESEYSYTDNNKTKDDLVLAQLKEIIYSNIIPEDEDDEEHFKSEQAEIINKDFDERIKTYKAINATLPELIEKFEKENP